MLLFEILESNLRWNMITLLDLQSTLPFRNRLKRPSPTPDY